MGQHYKNIVAELAERVPELAAACRPEIETFLEQCQRGMKAPLSPEEIKYLTALQAQNPDQFCDRIEEPLAYLVFEGDVIRFLVELVQNPEKHARLQEIMNWLEELIHDSDSDVRDLIGISFGEWLTSNGCHYLSQFWPFIGPGLRQSCRECGAHFRMSEEDRRLLNQI